MKAQRKHHTEESQKMKQLASRELKYLSDRAHFWRQQKSTLRLQDIFVLFIGNIE